MLSCVSSHISKEMCALNNFLRTRRRSYTVANNEHIKAFRPTLLDELKHYNSQSSVHLTTGDESEATTRLAHFLESVILNNSLE